MKQCEARKKFYAERKAELNIQYMELQQVSIFMWHQIQDQNYIERE